MLSFFIVGYVWQILGGWGFCFFYPPPPPPPPPPSSVRSPEKPVLNRVKQFSAILEKTDMEVLRFENKINFSVGMEIVKGLGEINSDHPRDTTFDSERRSLLQ